MAKRFPSGQPSAQPAPDDRQRALLERYVRAWEGADVDGFVALLRDDAILSMPHWRQWYLGREAIRAFMAWVWGSAGYGPYYFADLPGVSEADERAAIGGVCCFESSARTLGATIS